MRSRLFRPIVYLLVAAQLLLTVPATAFSGASSGATPCDEMGMAASHDEACPCCPDGAESMKDCLASCTLAAAVVPGVTIPALFPAPSQRVTLPPAAPLNSLTDPPVKPPPIR